MAYFEVLEDGIIYRYNGETVCITAWGMNALRVRAVPFGEIPDDPGALLPRKETSAEAAAHTQIKVTDERNAVITNGAIEARLFVQTWRNDLQISYYNDKGELLIKEGSDGGALNKTPRLFIPAGEGYRLKAEFIADPDEKLYGMGQYQQDDMNLKGCSLELAHRNSQASVPFCVSSKGYGFLWNNPAIGEVHFGKNVTQWTAELTDMLDYWITAGSGPADIEHAYADAVGKVPMMPEYGLGFWQCKLRYYNQEELLSVAREYKKRNIPIDVIVIDYYHWPRCGDWRFDPEYFPDPEAMAAELREMGIELMVSFWPQVDWRSENYEEMKQEGLLVRNNGGVDAQMIYHGNNVFLDPTNPRTRKYVWEKAKENYGRYGIRLFWLDEAEPEYTGYAFGQYRYHAGQVLKVGNLYPRDYARLFYDGMTEGGQDKVVNLLRCAWAGSQRYGALVWSGDIYSTYEAFRNQIVAGLHMGLAGIPWWTTDIGGFHHGRPADPDYRELFVRWFQFGTFCPVMRVHGAREPFTTIVNAAGEEREKTGCGNEVWSYGEENYPILVHYIEIRELMRDYIRGLMEQAHEAGDPVMRTLFYEFPDDPHTWDVKDSYMFGPDILVAPVTVPHAVSRKVYLPAGASWTDARDGKVYEGGQMIEADAPIESLPVFLRDGRQNGLIGKV